MASRLLTLGMGGKKAEAAPALPWYLTDGVVAGDVIAAYQAKGAANFAVAKVNLVTPGTYDLTDGGSPGWDGVNGFVLDGIDDYLKMDAYQVKTPLSALVRYSGMNPETTNWFICNEYVVSKFFAINVGTDYEGGYYNGGQYGIGGGSYYTIPPVSGVWGLSGDGFYLNGIKKAAIVDNTFTTTDHLVIGAHKASVPDQFAPMNIQAIALYGKKLTDGQMDEISANMAAL